MTGCFRGVIMCLLRRRFMNIYELSVLPGAWTAPALRVTPPPPPPCFLLTWFVICVPDKELF